MQSAAKKWLGLTAIGCIACCAVPIVAVLGLAGVTGSLTTWMAGANAETVLCLGLLAALAAGAACYVMRKKRASKQACGIVCKVDASCCNGDSNAGQSRAE